jgi:hypothetical protein
MFQIAYAFRMFLGRQPGDLGAAIIGAIIDEQQFPVWICLLENAFYGFL